MEWLVVSLLGLWFAATVAYQIWFLPLLPWVRRFDIFRVLPSWRLFPSIFKDLRLYYRDRNDSGTISEWKLIPMLRSRKPWRALWNPDLIYPDAQLSYMEFLVAILGLPFPPDHDKIQLSVSARALGIIAANQPAADRAITRQFEMREAPLGDARESEGIVYTSSFEPLPPLK